MTKKKPTTGLPKPPLPLDWYQKPGETEPGDAKDLGSIPILDEEKFMKAVAERLNAFIDAYPLEAQQVLGAFIPYQHELVEIHNRIRELAGKPEGVAGIRVGQLFAAVLQTHHGNGFALYPVIIPNPKAGPDCVRIARFVVDRQDEEDSPHQA